MKHPVLKIEMLDRICQAQDHLREILGPFTLMYSPDEKKQALIEKVRESALHALTALEDLAVLVGEK